MRSRSLLRVLRFSPLFFALALVVVWFAVPGELRSGMLSAEASSRSTDGFPSSAADRRVAAEAFLHEEARTRASANWPETRFAEVARRSAAVLPEVIDEASRAGTPPTTPIDPSDPSMRVLKRFADGNPGYSVRAYLVPQPVTPPVVSSMTAFPEERTPGEYAALWQRFVGTPATTSFRPDAWRDERQVAKYAPSSLWTFVSRSGPDTPSLVFVYRAEYPLKVAAPSKVHDAFSAPDRTKWMDTDLCAACHPAHAAIAGDSARQRLIAAGTGHTALVGGPVQMRVSPLFSSDASGSASLGRKYLEASLKTTDTAHLRLPDASGPDARNRWGTMIWQVPPDASRGQTVLYVCTYPGDPRAEFAESMGRAPVAQIRALRALLAANLPWLLGAVGVLLGVSLVVAPVAYTIELRRESRQRSAEELARIQRDAHDRVYNRLTALSHRVDEAASQPDGESSRLSTVGADIRATVADLQTILGAGERSGRDQETSPLAAQLQAVAVAQASLHGIEVSFSATGSRPHVAARMGWDLQCVLEEGITNAVKHGHATRVTVELESDAHSARLRVTDNGDGLTDGGEPGRLSTGVSGMRARLSAWQGAVTLEDADSGAALTVELRIPEG